MSKVGTRLISIVSQPIEVVVVVVLAVVVVIIGGVVHVVIVFISVVDPRKLPTLKIGQNSVAVVIVVVVVVIVIVVGPRYLALNFGQNWVSNS